MRCVFAEVVVLLMDSQAPFSNRPRIADLIERSGARARVIGVNTGTSSHRFPAPSSNSSKKPLIGLPQVKACPSSPVAGLTGAGPTG